jgi:hypothetical protein
VEFHRRPWGQSPDVTGYTQEDAMAVRAVALIVLAVGFAAPAHADSTDDAFITNLSTSGMGYGAPDRAIQVAKTVVCGTLSKNPNTSNADLVAKVTSATSWPPLSAAYFTGAAMQAYCPQYGSLDMPPVPSAAPALPPKPPVQST